MGGMQPFKPNIMNKQKGNKDIPQAQESQAI